MRLMRMFPLLLCLVAVPRASPAQDDAGRRTPLPMERAPGEGLRRSRLYLKDGSYQVVLQWRVQGQNVVFRSAERAGEEEQIPVRLVDLDATRKWEAQRDAIAAGKPELDPELAREEAARAARTPEVAKDLRLSDGDSVLALDVFQGQPQLAVLQQTDGELNRQTAHNVLRAAINPLSTAHQLVEIKGVSAPVQMHVPDPEIYLRLEADDDTVASAGAMRVDTGGAAAVRKDQHASAGSRYVIVRAEVRRDIRVVSSFNIGMLGSTRRQEDVIETAQTVLPGGHWLKIVPKEPLRFGEYALMEVLDDRNVNLGVWDFGVHPTAPANRDAILPEARRKPSLNPRRAQPQ